MNLDSNKSKRLSSICSWYLALLPVMQPYAFVGSLQLSLVVGFAITCVCLYINRRIYLEKSIFGVLLVDLVCGIMCVIFFNNSQSLLIIKSLLVISFFILIISTMLYNATWKFFINSANKVCVVACAIIFLQYIMMQIGINPFDGRIDFLELMEEGSWSPISIHNIYRRRVHSIFSEPSYFAMYCAPLFYYNLNSKKYIFSAIIILGVIISTSSLGIALCAVSAALFLWTLMASNGVSIGRRIIAVGILTIISFIILRFFSDSEAYVYSMSKIGSIFSGESSSIRIEGNIQVVNSFSLFNWIFGIGINQIPIVYPGLLNYSNAFVLTVIYYGVVGSIAYLMFLGYLAKSIDKEGKKYFIILLVALLFDALLFTMNYYYLLSFVYLNFKKKSNGYIALFVRRL